MEKDRSRGQKHRTNKKKYSNFNNNFHSTTHKPTKSLESNFFRYNEEEEEEDKTKLSSSTDFSLLANAPISHGSYFKFKSDKDSIYEIEETNQSALFNLDLVLLEKSLATIPFYERSGIDRNKFSEGQIEIMNNTANKIHDYNVYVQSYQQKDSDVIFGSNDETNDPIEETQTIVGTETPEDLEQWLDDILDA